MSLLHTAGPVRLDEPRVPSGEIAETLRLAGSPPGRRVRRAAVAAVVLAVIAASALAVARSTRSRPASVYQTEPARRGTLLVTLTATGELKSLTQVNIGTELSGVVESVTVDFNSPVKVGQVLATVNTDKLQAQASQARASLDSSKARREQSAATLREAQAQLARLQEVFSASAGRVPSRLELDSQEATVTRALADVNSANAQITQSEASLAAIVTDLKKASIRSPIDGLVLDRQIDPGQTVAASFQTPVLFTLAEDLTRMKLVIDVDEADIGSVRVGQTATFSVDAYPERVFPSHVAEIRSIPKTSGGVVTYQAVLSVDNRDLLLRPGMTATATIEIQKVVDALLVPNAALRFTPPAPRASTGFSLLPRPPADTAASPVKTEGARVYTPQADGLKAIPVQTGATDGIATVITGGDLAPGAAVVVDLAAK